MLLKANFRMGMDVAPNGGQLVMIGADSIHSDHSSIPFIEPAESISKAPARASGSERPGLAVFDCDSINSSARDAFIDFAKMLR
jgi:hypothetical protein